MYTVLLVTGTLQKVSNAESSIAGNILIFDVYFHHVSWEINWISIFVINFAIIKLASQGTFHTGMFRFKCANPLLWFSGFGVCLFCWFVLFFGLVFGDKRQCFMEAVKLGAVHVWSVIERFSKNPTSPNLGETRLTAVTHSKPSPSAWISSVSILFLIKSASRFLKLLALQNSGTFLNRVIF